jgi:transcription-repair coupling factor (superfamily II helicase)
VENESQLEDVRKELQDRYGPVPAPVRYLLAASALKLLCERTGVLNIDRKRDAVTVKFTEQAAVDPERLAKFVAQTHGAQFTPGGVLRFTLKSTRPEAIMEQVSGLLRELSAEPVFDSS